MSVKSALRALGAAVVALIGTTLAWFLIRFAQEVTGGIHGLDIDPRSGAGGLYVTLLGIVGVFAGRLAARLGGPAARLAAIGLALAFALLGALAVSVSGRELDPVIMLVVMPPCSLLGGELWLREKALARADA